MADKKTLMVVSDGACTPTGFGRVSEAVLDRLHDTGKWDIKQLGINYFDEDHDKPYRIFSASAGGSGADWLGLRRIKSLYEEVEPDAVWIFQDFWHIANYIKMVPEMEGIVTYFPVDSPNIKSSWAIAQAAAVEVCTYTQFGAEEFAKSMGYAIERIEESARQQDKDEIKIVNIRDSSGKITVNVSADRIKQLSDPSNINVIPHGIEQDKFFPVPKLAARSQLGFSQDDFIVGNVNRNQSRKRLDLTMRGFAKFAEGKDDVKLLFHDPISTQEGWDLQQLADEYFGIGDKVLISNQRLTNSDLNLMYNCVDVMVNTGGGEGWGLCSAESAQCKVPQIVPNWSATKEIWEGSGILLDVISIIHEQGKINTAQCVVDHDHLASELEGLYNNPDKLEKVGQACYDAMQKDDYDWDAIAETFDHLFEKAADQKVIEPKPYIIT